MATQRFDESIFKDQTPGTGLVPPGASTVTNPLLVPLNARQRLRHFDEDVFDLSAESHIVRFLSVLLGEAGAGQVRQQQTLRRMASMADGAHFLDLDAFYGSVLGLGRLVSEAVPAVRNKNYRAEEWDAYHAADGRYRSRVEQFARALNLGPTEHGLRLAVKVLLGDEAEVFEAWRYIDNAADMATAIGRGDDRKEVVIRPARDISAYERRALLRALGPLTPADVTLSVETTGIGGFTQSALNAAWSPDDDYEVVLRVTSGGVSQEQPRPPLTAYQSDAWSVLRALLDITSVSSGNATAPNHSRVQFPTGATVDFLPKAALIREGEVRSGRLASDGIVLRHPYTDLRNEERDPTSVLYVDRQPVDSIRRQRTTDEPAKFWASPRRLQSDKTLEYLTTEFAAAQRVNHVSLEFSRFPCRVAVQVLDGEDWKTVGSMVETQSFPEREAEPDVSVDGALLHPLHRGARHWRKMSVSFDAYETTKVRLVLQRGKGMGPVDVSDYPVAYSLAVRRLDVGYRVRRREDFPASYIDRDEPLLLGASQQDGDTYEYLAHQRRASHLVDDLSTIWKSAPQPVPDAVVPLYLDVRDGRRANSVSRIDLDPVTEGATINLYRATEAPVAPAPGATGSLAAAMTVVDDLNGDGPVDVAEGWRVTANTGFTVPCAAVGLGLDTPFWAAVQYRPDKGSSAWGGDYILDLGGLKVRLLADTLRVESGGWASERFVDAPAQGIATVSVGYTPADGTLTVRHLSLNQTREWTVTVPEADRPAGDDVWVGFFPGNLRAVGVFSYAERDERVEAFEQDPAAVLLQPHPWEDRPDLTSNLCLRFHPEVLVQDPDALGFSGGPSVPYDAIAWKAVPGTYRLKRGALLMPPTLTGFIKMEFSDLSPEPASGFFPTARTYRTFPQSIVERGANIAATHDYRRSDGGQRTLSALSRDRFDDRDLDLRLSLLDTIDRDRRPKTEALVADDLDAQQRLRERSWMFGFTRWQTDRRTASMGDGVHVYAERTAINQFGVGYTVGLRHITVYDDDYSAASDTRSYVENFQTVDRWALEGDLVHTPGSLKQTQGLWGKATSQTWLSSSPVEGVQFAALGSPPRPMLDNESFDYPDDYLYDSSPDSEWHVVGDAQAFTTPEGVRVDRRIYATNFAIDGLPYGDDGSNPGTDDDMEDYTYGELENRSAQQGVEGGIESPLAYMTNAGTLRAAVRITGVQDTSDNPVLVQIVRVQDDTIVAQTGVVAVPGQTVNADVEFSIEQSADFVQYTYGDHEVSDYSDLELSTYGQLEVYSLVINLTDGFRLRVVQESAPAGIWVVGKGSLYEDNLRWEFSNDNGATWVLAGGVANNPDGVVSFKEPDTELVVRLTTLAPGAGVTALQVRPLYTTRRHEDPLLRAATDGATEAPAEALLPIREDPMFKMWSEPIPREWYLT